MAPSEIRKLIEKKGASAADIAAGVKVSPAAVNGVINGTIKSRRIATIISLFLGVPVDKLWPGQYPATYKRNRDGVMRELQAAAMQAERLGRAA